MLLSAELHGMLELPQEARGRARRRRFPGASVEGDEVVSLNRTDSSDSWKLLLSQKLASVISVYVLVVIQDGKQWELAINDILVCR